MDHINPSYRSKSKSKQSPTEIAKSIIERDRYALSQAITYAESNDPFKKELSTETVELNTHFQIFPGHPNISFVKASFRHLQFFMSIKQKVQNKEKNKQYKPKS